MEWKSQISFIFFFYVIISRELDDFKEINVFGIVMISDLDMIKYIVMKW